MPPLPPGARILPRNLAALAVLLVLAGGTRAQCTGSLDLGPDVSVCTGTQTTLHAPDGFVGYTWEDGTTGQDHTVTAPGTFTCTVTQFGGSTNLVVNGDFSGGSAGFNSDYTVGVGGPWGPLSDPGTYNVTTDPSLVHDLLPSCHDHTTGTGTGNMLAVNGADVADLNVWCQTIPVQQHTDYAFSTWLTSIASDNPAILAFTINGIPVGDPLAASPFTGDWQQFDAVWNSGSSTSATICITNQNIGQGGNDFALDDISFSPMCVYSDQIEVIGLPYPQPDLGADVSVCAGTPVTLDPHWPTADSYYWSNGVYTPTLTPALSATYWVDVTEDGCTTRDSIDVLFKPLPHVGFGIDQDRCDGDEVVLNATNNGAHYTWQDGSSNATFTVSGTGLYDVLVDLDGCTATDTITITYHPMPIVDLGPDTTICADSPYTIDVDRPGGSYVWDDGSTVPQRFIDAQQWYWVDVTESVCTVRDSLRVRIKTLPVVDLRPDFLLCVGEVELLDAFGPDYTYAWQDGSTDSTYTIDGPGFVRVTVSNSCGHASDSLFVTQGFCDCPVFVPNTFTPDGDGMNDAFNPVFDCPVDMYTLSVYDRWGKVIWSTEDPALAWDGEGTPDGVYTWDLAIRTVTVTDNKRREYRGHVVLLR